MRQTPRYHALASLFSLAAATAGCVLTDNGDDAETVGNLSLTGSDSSGSDDDGDPSNPGMDATGADPATSAATTDAPPDPTTEDPSEATSDGDTDGGNPDDGQDATGEATGASGCEPGEGDGACEVCVASNCCESFLECSQGGTSFECDCHTSCLDEGYPAECSTFCGPAPDAFGPLLACAQQFCTAQCGL